MPFIQLASLWAWHCEQESGGDGPDAGIILVMGAADVRRRYNVTSSPIGWAHTHTQRRRRLILAERVPRDDVVSHWLSPYPETTSSHIGWARTQRRRRLPLAEPIPRMIPVKLIALSIWQPSTPSVAIKQSAWWLFRFNIIYPIFKSVTLTWLT